MKVLGSHARSPFKLNCLLPPVSGTRPSRFPNSWLTCVSIETLSATEVRIPRDQPNGSKSGKTRRSGAFLASPMGVPWEDTHGTKTPPNRLPEIFSPCFGANRTYNFQARKQRENILNKWWTEKTWCTLWLARCGASNTEPLSLLLPCFEGKDSHRRAGPISVKKISFWTPHKVGKTTWLTLKNSRNSSPQEGGVRLPGIEDAIIVQRQGCIVVPSVSNCNSHGHIVDGALAAKKRTSRCELALGPPTLDFHKKSGHNLSQRTRLFFDVLADINTNTWN